MGVSGVAHIQSGLLGGLPASTPVAIVQNASLPQQRQLLCSLGDMALELQQAGITSPAVIVVGEVLSLNPALALQLATQAPVAQRSGA